MSLKLYTFLLAIVYLLILFVFSILTSLFICIVQLNFEFWGLYLLRIINHLFEPFNSFSLFLFFILSTFVTYKITYTRNFIVIFIITLILYIVLNLYDLKSIFIYKSRPIDQYFYVYFTSYLISLIIWYIILKKIWKNLN